MDGWSVGIFAAELNALYPAVLAREASPLPELSIQYADFAEWQRDALRGEALDRELAYWRNQLAGAPHTLDLPSDRARPQAPSFRGARYAFTLPAELSEQLRGYPRDNEGVTLFMTLLAGFAGLLHRYTGQAGFLVGTPVANRNSTQLEPLIGMFVNTVVLRADLFGDPAFADLVHRFRDVCVDAYEHQGVPFDKVVEELSRERDLSRNPLFQVIFALQNAATLEVSLPGVETIPLELDGWQSRFDLELHVRDNPGQLSAEFVYSTDLFDDVTVRRMAEHLIHFMGAALAAPGKPLSQLPLTPDRGLAQPGTAREDDTATIPVLFDDQAARRPTGAAVIRDGEVLTYAELRRQADRLADRLTSIGVRAGTRVGVYLPAIPLRVVAILAVLKAGAVYAGIDPDDPPGVARDFLRDARIEAVVTAGRLPPLSAHDGVQIIDLDHNDGGYDGAGTNITREEPDVRIDAESPAVIVCSAGGPLSICHGALAQAMRSLQDVAGLTDRDVVYQGAPAALDVSVWEMLWPLLNGSAVAVRGAASFLPALAAVADSHRVTAAFLTPTQLHDLARRSVRPTLPTVRIVLCTGERLTHQVVTRFLADFRGNLHYLFGLPEAGGLVMTARCEPGLATGFVSAGMPAAVSVSIRDRNGQPTAPGEVGHLHVAGSARDGREMPAGQDARWLSDGRIDIVGDPRSYTWADGYQAAPGPIRSAILRDPAVRDCVIVPRLSARGLVELTAIVAPAGSLRPEALAESLRRELPEALVPRAFAMVSTLPPRDPAGTWRVALDGVPVIDGELASSWQERLDAAAGPGRVTVSVADARVPQGRIHTGELLAGERAAPAAGRGTVAERGAASAAADPITPSIADGGPARSAGVETLPDALARAARTRGATPVIHLDGRGGERRQPYRELLSDAERVLGGLRRLGVSPGDRLILQLAVTSDFVVGFWACVLGGFVPVPMAVPPGYAEGVPACARLAAAWQTLGSPWVLTDAAHAAPLRDYAAANGWGDVQAGIIGELAEHDPDHVWHTPSPDDVALMLLTSGSTGRPKAVMLRHRNILGQAAGSAERNGCGPADVIFNWMPLDHVGGIVMCHVHGVVLCCTQVHAPTPVVLAAPLRWLDWADQYRATMTWAPSFAFGLVLDRLPGGRSWNLSALRFILNGGEAVSARTARRFLAELASSGLPPTAMHPAWGMSETSSAVLYSGRFRLDTTADDDAFVEVGAPMPGLSARIVDAAGTVVPEGEPGRLEVTGVTVTAGYYRNHEASAEAFTADGWFDTGDLAVMRGGQITITGRVKDVIIINGINYHSHEIESAVEELEFVDRSYTAACAVRVADAASDELAVFLHLHPGTPEGDALREVRRQVMRQVGINPAYLIPVDHAEIPKTEIGKIQRSLLRQRFETGEYASVLRRIDMLLAGPSTMPAWFYRPVWRRSEPPGTVARASGDTLVILDAGDIGQRVADALRRRGERCVTANPVPGTALRATGPGSYTFDASSPDHYNALFQALDRDGVAADRIVYLPLFARDRAGIADLADLAGRQLGGVLGIRRLIHAAAATRRPDQAIALRVVTSFGQQIDDDDHLACDLAALPGLISSISQEIPWLRGQLLDLAPDDTIGNVARILGELEAEPTDTEVAFRGSGRLVRRLAPADYTSTGRPVVHFRRGGLYAITGGLGGVGVAVATYLLTHHDARVLLIGRTALPADHQPTAYQQLRSLSPHVMYVAADVCDQAQLQAAFDEAESRWSTELAGVFHLAGRFDQRPLLDQADEEIEAVLAPKVYGAWNLYQLLKDRAGLLLVFFSSVNGHVGGPMVASYAAANSFLSGFSRHVRRGTEQNGAGPICQDLAWSMWDETGMSRGYPLKERTKASGYHILTQQEGIESLLVARQFEVPCVIIGIDPNGLVTRSIIDEPPRPLHKIVADPGDWGAAGFSNLMVRDRYGRETTCELAAATHDERGTGSGTAGRADADPGHEPASSEELLIASIWQDVLRRDRLAADDNFFDLGGSSVQMTVAHEKINLEFGRDVSMADLFRYPTIRSLARYLKEGRSAGDTDSADQRAAKRKDARKRRSQRSLKGSS
jgi:acyl-CoA synthetase (AMP-forming)/AMP-acid ligase II/NADP-dependent 3-hydroxy acid dehydrogenase YdfG